MDPDPEPNPALIEMDQFYPYAPELVWRALTDSTLVAEWFMESVGYSAEVGSDFMFLIPTEPPAEIVCTVIECEPMTRLTWRWVDTRSESPTAWPVAWTVDPHGRGSRLMLSQSGFDLDDRRQRMARSGMSRFWRTPFARLGPVLESL